MRLATGRNLVILFFLFILTASVFFPLMSSLIEHLARELYKIDTKFNYTPAELDVLFPIVYAFFFGLLIAYVFPRAFPIDSRVQRLNLVPFGFLLFDLIENAGIVILLLAYPTQMEGLARLTGMVTSVKWVLAGITVALPLAGAVVWLFRSLRGWSPGDPA